MTRYRGVVFSALLALAYPGLAEVEPARRVDSAAEAIELAERFVLEQGYTDSGAKPDRFRHELRDSDESKSVADVLSERAGTLDPKAYAYLKDPVAGFDQWWIYFRYLEQPPACPELFGVVVFSDPDSPDSPESRSLMVMDDIRQKLLPDATVLPGRPTSSCRGSESDDPLLPSGDYVFMHKFAEGEQVRFPGSPVTVRIDGRHIVVINNESTSVFPVGVIDQGTLMWHAASRQWIIGTEADDADAAQVGGCSDGPLVVDLKRRIFWTC